MKRKQTNKPIYMKRKRKRSVLKENKKMFYASSVALSLLATGLAAPTISALEWTPRNVSEISTELVNQGGQLTYTIKYGDTLSAIADAMNLDMEILAKVNQITDVNLIFPDTVLTTTVDQNNQVTQIEIEAPAQTANQEPVQATVDLQTNQATIDDTVVHLDEVEVPAPATEPTAPVAETEVPADIPAEVATVEVPQVSVPETTEAVAAPAAEQVAPVEAPVAEPVAETPVVEPASESVVAEEPVVETPVAETPAPVATVVYDNSGLQPQVTAFKEEVATTFGITSFSGYRPGDPQDHGKGLAIDFMVPVSSALGDQVADYAIANMGARNISYIIWKQRFYSPYPSIYGPAYTWNPMPDRGSVTENHYDHVHVSFNP
ncbi:LysM peptidoglycan-binding domain-containing protein [Streptococcus suis]|nr:LysM peptidoglycan-binding domain-containing protein [Streptococcus suis]NQO46826.1 LysM peptidoglycan-binding domain-containing protein [Streptococcus suis]WNF83693.1 LysM peptidoglycan-binding domain-containing protein [Streptococcus suis]